MGENVVKRFSGDEVWRMRRGMSSALSVPAEDMESPPEDIELLLENMEFTPENLERLLDDRDSPSDGMRISPVDPTKVAAKLKALRLKPGLVLRGYLFREGGNGSGFVYAMPEDAPFPEPEECPTEKAPPLGLFNPPRPPDALEHVMDAFEGDGSPLSFLEASILFRELEEFGAVWHGCSWSCHTILCDYPVRSKISGPYEVDTQLLSGFEHWPWKQPQPNDWRPMVQMEDDGSARVEFITFCGLGLATIFKHVDTYQPASLRLESQIITMAQGEKGYKV